MKSYHEWLDHNLRTQKKSGKTQKELAKLLGISPSGVSEMAAGKREIGLHYVQIMSEFFKVSPPQLAEAFPVPVIGKIGAGGNISTVCENLTSPLFTAHVDFHPKPTTIAYQISGDSMFPKYKDGDIIFVDSRGDPPELIVGSDAVIFIEDEGRFLKEIARGSQPGLFDLISHNAPPMRDKQIRWASRVKGSAAAGTFDVRLSDDDLGI